MTLIHWGCFLSLPACRHCTCILTCFCLPGFLQQKILWKKNCLLNFPFIFTKSQQVMPTGLSISLFLFSMFFILEIIDLLINKTNILFFWVVVFICPVDFFLSPAGSHLFANLTTRTLYQPIPNGQVNTPQRYSTTNRC